MKLIALLILSLLTFGNASSASPYFGALLIQPEVRLRKDFGKESPDPDVSGQGFKSTGEILRTNERNCRFDKRQLINMMVKIFPGKQAGQKNISVDFFNTVNDGLSSFPYRCLSLLAENGCEIRLSPFVTDAVPRLVGLKPAGGVTP